MGVGSETDLIDTGLSKIKKSKVGVRGRPFLFIEPWSRIPSVKVTGKWVGERSIRKIQKKNF